MKPTEEMQRFEDEILTSEMRFEVIAVPPELARADGEPADERIPISISSEYGVERYDWETGETYIEVLGHAPSDINLSRVRADDGLPFLKEHYGDQVGKVENVSVTAEGKMRGMARQGAHPDGAWIFADMRSGVRKNISVGYRRSREYTQTKDERGTITRRYRNWMPIEVSSVPIPADPTVGAGRSVERARGPVVRSLEPQRGKESTMEAEVAAQLEAEKKARAAADAKSHRTAKILEFCETGKCMDQARAFIESDKSIEDVGREVIRLANEAAERRISETREQVKLTSGEQQKYSIVRAVNAILEGKRDGLEFDISQELERKLNRRTTGKSFLVPTGISASREGDLSAQESRTLLSVGGSTKGAELKFTEYGGFIEMLRAALRLPQLGARFMPGLQGDINFVRQTGAASFQWMATEVANASAGSLTLETRGMVPKAAQANSPYTRQLLRQSVESIESLVREDLAAINARGIETAVIRGATNGPTGLISTSGIGAVVGGTNGALPDYDDVVDLQREIGVDDVLPGAIKFLTTVGIGARLKKTQKFATTNGQPIWEGSVIEGNMDGLPALTSSLVPSNLTKGTSTTICHALIAGVWENLVIGEWGAFELFVDELTQGPSIIALKSYALVDSMLRHPQAFAAMLDALA